MLGTVASGLALLWRAVCARGGVYVCVRLGVCVCVRVLFIWMCAYGCVNTCLDQICRIHWQGTEGRKDIESREQQSDIKQGNSRQTKHLRKE